MFCFLKFYLILHVWLCCLCLVPEEVLAPPGTGVTDGCEVSCGCWKSNLGLLQEQSVLLTAEVSSLVFSVYLKGD